jgi:catechol 2,3-dioxygenase-like lactoylglutathione lyase family enzyme
MGTVPPTNGVLEASLYVADLDRSYEFYQRVFGFERFVHDGRMCALDVPGSRVLHYRMRRVSAVVTADGTVAAGAVRGSIHKVGATVQNAPSRDGWTFWHFERDGVLVPLDVLRAPGLVEIS